MMKVAAIEASDNGASPPARTSPVWPLMWGLIIVALTLMPEPGWPGARQNFFASLVPLTLNGWQDVAANILFYLPFGISLAAAGFSTRRSTAIALALSTTLELLQYLAPGRDPSARDIAANTAGAALAAAWLLTGLGRRAFAILSRWDALSKAAARAEGRTAAVLSLAWAIMLVAVLTASVLLLASSPAPGERYVVRGPILDTRRGPIIIGSGDGDTTFHGLIDDVRVYGRALSAADVRADAESPVATDSHDPTLIAAFGFDEGTGDVARDASGNGHAGTLRGAAWAPLGHSGGALSFDGTHSRVVVAESPQFDLVNEMTLEAWVYPTEWGSRWSTVIDHHTYSLLSSSDAGAGVPAGGGVFGQTVARVRLQHPIPLRTWTHVCTTYDGQTLRLYINGVLANTRLWWSSHRVSSASVDGTPVPYARPVTRAALASALRDSGRLDLGITCGEWHTDPAPVFLITAPGSRIVIEVLAAGTDLLVRGAMRANRLLMTAPDARFAGALSGCAPGRDIDVSISGPLQHPRVFVGGIENRASVLGLGSGWAFVVHSELLWPSIRLLCAALWLGVLCVPLGYWGRASIWTAVGVAIAVGAVVLLPKAAGVGDLDPGQACGAIAGVLTGLSVRGARRRVSAAATLQNAITGG